MEIGDFKLKQRKITKKLVKQKTKESEETFPRLKDLMRLYREIFGVQRKYLPTVDITIKPLSDLQIRARVEEGIPLIDRQEMEIDYSFFRTIFLDIAKVFLKRGKNLSDETKSFLLGDNLDSGTLKELGEAFLHGQVDYLERQAEELKVESSILKMMLHLTFAVFFEKIALQYQKKADLDQVTSIGCPICGSPPMMGFNREGDGLRVLECSLCGSRWGVPRLACPFCHDSQQEGLKYVFVEGDNKRRIYTCERCKRYIKIVDRMGEPGEVLLPVEDLLTGHLDQLAKERGYIRSCASVFS